MRGNNPSKLQKLCHIHALIMSSERADYKSVLAESSDISCPSIGFMVSLTPGYPLLVPFTSPRQQVTDSNRSSLITWTDSCKTGNPWGQLPPSEELHWKCLLSHWQAHIVIVNIYKTTTEKRETFNLKLNTFTYMDSLLTVCTFRLPWPRKNKKTSK